MSSSSIARLPIKHRRKSLEPDDRNKIYFHSPPSSFPPASSPPQSSPTHSYLYYVNSPATSPCRPTHSRRTHARVRSSPGPGFFPAKHAPPVFINEDDDEQEDLYVTARKARAGMSRTSAPRLSLPPLGPSVTTAQPHSSGRRWRLPSFRDAFPDSEFDCTGPQHRPPPPLLLQLHDLPTPSPPSSSVALSTHDSSSPSEYTRSDHGHRPPSNYSPPAPIMLSDEDEADDTEDLPIDPVPARRFSTSEERGRWGSDDHLPSLHGGAPAADSDMRAVAALLGFRQSLIAARASRSPPLASSALPPHASPAPQTRVPASSMGTKPVVARTASPAVVPAPRARAPPQQSLSASRSSSEAHPAAPAHVIKREPGSSSPPPRVPSPPAPQPRRSASRTPAAPPSFYSPSCPTSQGLSVRLSPIPAPKQEEDQTPRTIPDYPGLSDTVNTSRVVDVDAPPVPLRSASPSAAVDAAHRLIPTAHSPSPSVPLASSHTSSSRKPSLASYAAASSSEAAPITPNVPPVPPETESHERGTSSDPSVRPAATIPTPSLRPKLEQEYIRSGDGPSIAEDDRMAVDAPTPLPSASSIDISMTLDSAVDDTVVPKAEDLLSRRDVSPTLSPSLSSSSPTRHSGLDATSFSSPLSSPSPSRQTTPTAVDEDEYQDTDSLLTSLAEPPTLLSTRRIVSSPAPVAKRKRTLAPDTPKHKRRRSSAGQEGRPDLRNDMSDDTEAEQDDTITLHTAKHHARRPVALSPTSSTSSTSSFGALSSFAMPLDGMEDSRRDVSSPPTSPDVAISSSPKLAAVSTQSGASTAVDAELPTVGMPAVSDPVSDGTVEEHSTPPSPTADECANDNEILGQLIETLATSRASALAPSTLYSSLSRARPQLAARHNKRAWLREITRVLEAGATRGLFGCVGASDPAPSTGGRGRKKGKAADTAGGRHVERMWFYIPEGDDDLERAAMAKAMMPERRAESRKFKRYYWKPLDKISRWDAEDEL